MEYFQKNLKKMFRYEGKPLRVRFKESKENKNNQRLAGLQHQAQQPHLATEANIKLDTKTRERTEGAGADEEKY